MNRVFTHWATLVLAPLAVVFFSASALAQTVTITDANCADFAFGGTTGARTLTCIPVSGGGGGPTVVPTCSVIGASSGTIGTAVALTASCAPGPITAGSYVWTGGTCANGSGATCNDTGSTAPATGGVVNYTVLAANSVGTGVASPAKAVTWSPAGGGGAGGGGVINCTGMVVNGVTISDTQVMQESWAQTTTTRKFTGGFGPTSALVVHFKTGSLTAPLKSGALTFFNSGSYTGSPMVATISTSPCDFGAGANPPMSQVGPSDSIQVFYQVGGTAVANGPAVFGIDTDVYVNMIQSPNPSCAANGGCDKGVDFSKPRGL
jgi:hypothetical protein